MKKQRPLLASLLLGAILYFTVNGYLFIVLQFLAWTFLVITGIVGLLKLLFAHEVSDADVYDALSSLVWKTVAEIERDIKAAKGISSEESIGAAISRSLEKLERCGAVERQMRTWDSERGVTDAKREPEFRRKADGEPRRVRRRFKIIRFAPQPI